LAFETIRGESGVDFIGSDGVDVLFALNETGAITASGNGGNDTINLSDSDNVIGTATVKGGAGNDLITFSDQDGGTNSRLSDSSVNGGAGNDTLRLAGSVGSTIRGNEDNDDFFLVGNYTNTTVNGNKGVDSFTLSGVTSLSNAKVLGGADNDGAMNFSAFEISAAVDSTINGSDGVDNITLGDVRSASNFTVFGGQGNDVITSNNDLADTVIYSGDKGDDSISTAAGTAKASILGGEGDDVITSGADKDTIDGGEGADTLTAGAEDDTINGGAGNDTITSGTGDDTINGGGGADSITVDGTESNVYVYSTVSDSAATITGSVDGFDTLTGADFAATEKVDLTAVGTSLVGDAMATTNQVVSGATIAVAAGDNVDNFADLRTFVNNGGALVASGAGGIGAGQISLQTITVVDSNTTNGDITGTYFVASNANTILDSGDMMWESTTVTIAGLEAAIEAGF